MSVAEARFVIPRASDQAVWPWQAEPYRLWSLLDMRQFFAHQFFANLEFLLIMRNEMFRESPEPITDLRASLLVRTLEPLRNHAWELNLKPVVAEIDHLLQRLRFREMTPIPGHAATEVIDSIRRRVNEALLAVAFFQLTPDEARWHSGLMAEILRGPAVHPELPWIQEKVSPRVKTAFPTDVPVEIASAWDCHATGNHTACVFHLMRGVEHGLRALVVAVGVTNPKLPLDYQEWHGLIQQVESRSTAAVDSWGTSAEQKNARQFFNRIVPDLLLFKDDVRNVTMHARKRYQGPETQTLIGRVNEWFEVLSFKVTEDMTGRTILDRALFAP